MVELLTIAAVLIGGLVCFLAVVLANLIAFWLSIYVLLRGVKSRLSETLEQTDLSDMPAND